jgi:hypothetical protein
VNDTFEGINLVKNSSKAHAFISNRNSLYYSKLEFGQKLFHLPPQTQDSDFRLDLIAIAMRKDFEYKKQFNRLYVNIK